MSKYKIIALIGEAGSGKDYLLRQALAKYKHYHEIISCTTRPKRDKELDGVNYYFLDDETFEKTRMFESTSFNGWKYGTSAAALAPNKINIGVFNPSGIFNLLNHQEEVELKVFYVRASAKTRLLRQLNRENEPNVDEIIRRYAADVKDFSNLNFNYTEILNEAAPDVALAIAQLKWDNCN